MNLSRKATSHCQPLDLPEFDDVFLKFATHWIPKDSPTISNRVIDVKMPWHPMYGSSPRSHQQRLVSSFATWLLIMMLEESTITPSLKYFMQLDKVMYIQEARVLKVAENKHLCKEDWMVS